jgi:acetolactate synthase-1/2/3 large subunit
MPQMTGSRHLVEVLEGYGVNHVFFVPAVLISALAEMEDSGIRRVMTHGEKSAVYMADGYARASGKPAICMAQNIGGSNLAAALRDAYMAGSPVIALTGGPAPATRYRNFYQEVEDFSQFEPVTKFNATVDDVTRFPDLLRQAFRVATSGAPGPVHLRLSGTQGDVVDRQADLHTIIESRFARVPAFRPKPETEQIRRAAELLAQARRPIIVAGGGVVSSGAQAEVVALAEKLSLPVATSLNAKGTIVDRHPLAVGVAGTYSRACANRALAEADLAFFIGSHTGGQVTTQWAVPRLSIPVIHLDIDPVELGRNYPNTTPILGDAKVALQDLLREAAPRPAEITRAWSDRVAQLVAEWRAQAAPMLDSDAVPMRPERVCKAISNVLPPDGVVVSDTGHSGIWSGTMIDFTHPGQRYIRCAGSLGWGLPAALGVKCALPDRPVICFAGDGAVYYHLAELETAARYGINVILVVNNNSALNQEIPLFDRAYGGKQRGRAEEMWRFRPTNFAQVANALGCEGIRVEQPGELEGALRRALAMDRPVVVDAVTDTYAFGPRAWVPSQAPTG